jgi:hypothetical protein
MMVASSYASKSFVFIYLKIKKVLFKFYELKIPLF